MKVWERERLEYRPTIGFTPNIKSIIAEIAAERDEFTPLPYDLNKLPEQLLTERAAYYLGTDAIDSLLASLSKAHAMVEDIKSKLSYDSNFQEYLRLSESDDPTDQLAADNLHSANIVDLNGTKEFDVYPLVAEAEEEMEQYLDFLNKNLFDGQVNYENTQPSREMEEAAISEVIKAEQEGAELDYSKLNARVQVIATAQKKVTHFENLLNKSEGYLDLDTKTYFDGDTETALYQLAALPEKQRKMVQDLYNVNFDSTAEASIGQKYNMSRIADREVREILDEQMVSVQNKMLEYKQELSSLASTFDEEEPYGMQTIKHSIVEGLGNLEKGFEYSIVENLSNTIQIERQTEGLFNNLTSKRQNQDLYALVDKMINEFDDRDITKEVERFIKINNLS